jgi:hypothetical protein
VACLAAGSAAAQLEPEMEAEELVRATWFEGLPLDRAAALGEADGVLLAGMLAEPAEAAHHANIVIALGACGCGPAYDALAQFVAAPPTGNDASARAALAVLPQAMGLLASQDARAMMWLAAEAARPAPPPGDRAARRQRVALMNGLALAGSPAADALLGRLEAEASAAGDTGMARRASQARARAQAGPTQ